MGYLRGRKLPLPVNNLHLGIEGGDEVLTSEGCPITPSRQPLDWGLGVLPVGAAAPPIKHLAVLCEAWRERKAWVLKANNCGAGVIDSTEGRLLPCMLVQSLPPPHMVS